MKRLITTLGFLVFSGSIFLFLFFASCSDDDEDPNDNIDVVGFWTVSEVDIQEASVGNQSVVDFYMNFGGMSEEEANMAYSMLETMIIASITGTIDIRGDNTYTSVLGGETVNGTWSQSADGKTIDIYDDTDDEFVAFIKTNTANMINIDFIYDTYQDLDLNPDTPDMLLTIEGNITMTK